MSASKQIKTISLLQVVFITACNGKNINKSNESKTLSLQPVAENEVITIGRGYDPENVDSPMRGDCIQNVRELYEDAAPNENGTIFKTNTNRVTSHDELMEAVGVSMQARVKGAFFKGGEII